MYDSTTSVTGRIDDLVCSLTPRDDGGEDLLTYNPDTGTASLAEFHGGRQVRVRYGYVHRGQFIAVACLVALCCFLGGCTGGMSFGWGPDGYRHESQSYRDVYVEHAQR